MTRNPGEVWNDEYQAGAWEFLYRPEEQIRYVVLAALLTGQQPNSPKRVLDLGCGLGILREHLSDSSVEWYTGVDWSSEAITRAQQRRHPRSSFIAAAIEEWEPDRLYDVIVFSEVLYYLADARSTVMQYLRQLRGSGAIFVSLWAPALSARSESRAKTIRARLRHAGIWNSLAKDFEVVADVVVKTRRSRRWRIRQLRPLRDEHYASGSQAACQA